MERAATSQLLIFILLVAGPGLMDSYAIGDGATVSFLRHDGCISHDGGRAWRLNPGNTSPEAVSGSDSGLYVQLLEFPLGHEVSAISCGDADGDGRQEMYVDHYPSYSVRCYEFQEDLVYEMTELMEYGLPWVLCDFNSDGNMELVLQRGDSGGGGNGYMDVYTWNGADFIFLQGFTFPGMKMVYHPTTYDLDGDGYPELIFSTAYTFTTTGFVRVATWDHDNGELEIFFSSQLTDAYGEIAAADFDKDGFGDFVIGSDASYSLYEMQDGDVLFRGLVGDTIESSQIAFPWAPKGDGDTLLVLATCLGFVSDNWRYEVHKSTGNDIFQLDTVFVETTQYAGIQRGGVADTDNDGMEEALMFFHPIARMVEWTGSGYTYTWSLDETSDLGTVVTTRIPVWDLNDDTYLDWILSDHLEDCHIYSLDRTGVEYPQAVGAITLVCTPNPSNGPVNMDFGPVRPGEQARAEVFDLRGRLVRKLVLGEDGQNMRTACWDCLDINGAAVPTGVYIVRATTGAEAGSSLLAVFR